MKAIPVPDACARCPRQLPVPVARARRLPRFRLHSKSLRRRVETCIGYGLRLQHSKNMRRNSPHPGLISATAALQRWVIAFLLVALPLCGGASAIAALMGARHFHAGTSPMQVNVGESTSQQTSVMPPARRFVFVHAVTAASDHQHDDLQRHHHDAANRSSVVSLDVSAVAEAARSELDASSAKTGASLSAWCGLPALVGIGVCETASPPRGEGALWSLQTADSRALRRPPKT